MAIVNVSLDTRSKQTVLTIDGMLVAADEVNMSKYLWEGEEFITFSYTTETITSDGLKERRQFYIPSPEELAVEAHAGLNDKGFASKVVYDDEKAKADVVDFFNKTR